MSFKKAWTTCVLNFKLMNLTLSSNILTVDKKDIFHIMTFVDSLKRNVVILIVLIISMLSSESRILKWVKTGCSCISKMLRSKIWRIWVREFKTKDLSFPLRLLKTWAIYKATYLTSLRTIQNSDSVPQLNSLPKRLKKSLVFWTMIISRITWANLLLRKQWINLHIKTRARKTGEIVCST
jgi:hypothetical protein